MVVRPLGALEPLPLVVVRTGQTPVRQGAPCTDLWVIESGVFAATLVDPDGRSFLVDLLGPGDGLGQPGQLASPWTATALRPARLRPCTDEASLAMLAVRTERAITMAAQLAWFGVAERIERRLVDLANRLGRPVPGGVVLPIVITQDDLASMVGATRESANRAIRTLLDRGSIELRGRGRYVVRTQLRLVPDAP